MSFQFWRKGASEPYWDKKDYQVELDNSYSIGSRDMLSVRSSFPSKGGGKTQICIVIEPDEFVNCIRGMIKRDKDKDPRRNRSSVNARICV